MTPSGDEHAEGETATPVAEHAAGEAASPAKPRARRRGRGLAYLALFVALAAGAGYIYYLYWLHQDREARVAALADELTEAGRTSPQWDDLSAKTDELRAEVAQLRQALQRQQQVLEETRTALAKATAEARGQQVPGPRAWRIAELEHLLRGANQRMLMDRDVRGARQLLRAAEDLLAELDDFALHEVRALVAEDVAALGRYRGVDVQGVFLRLEALRGAIGSLPVRLPQLSDTREGQAPAANAADVPEDAAEGSFLDALLGRLEGLVRFRRHEGEAVRPLLPPEQVEYLEQHLLLAVDRAQLAVLRRDQAVFDATLAAADEWLEAYLDPASETVRRVRAELDSLRQVELATPPPDLSRPLARLRQLRDQRPAARDETADDSAAQ